MAHRDGHTLQYQGPGEATRQLLLTACGSGKQCCEPRPHRPCMRTLNAATRGSSVTIHAAWTPSSAHAWWRCQQKSDLTFTRKFEHKRFFVDTHKKDLTRPALKISYWRCQVGCGRLPATIWCRIAPGRRDWHSCGANCAPKDGNRPVVRARGRKNLLF